MTARVQSFILSGIGALSCEVELDWDETGITKETVVGLPDAAVRESLERVRSALANSGYAAPAGRLLVNLAPADVRKEGPVYDLPIALGILGALGIVRGVDGTGRRGDGLDLRRYMVAGEMALDGRVRPIRGVVAMASLAAQRGCEGVIVPWENRREAAAVEGIRVFGVSTLSEVVGLLNGTLDIEPEAPIDLVSMIASAQAPVDFGDVRGQEGVKRAMMVAAAGGHNLLMLGPAGTGKTMMARALPGILPALTPQEAIEVTRVYSAAGHLIQREDERGENGGDWDGLMTTRPVRSPHHTASAASVIGGGAVPRPGEISLAHRGVLFMDELPEFPRAVLDTLRQPLEEGEVTVTRAHSAVTFPARFMLIAAMNPTPRGDVPTDEVGRRAMERYLGRVSRPLIDRVDIHVEAPPVPWKELSAGPAGTTSAEMRQRVVESRAIQRNRQGAKLNGELSGRALDELGGFEDSAISLLGEAIQGLGLSARAYDKIRRVSRTVADLDGAETVGEGAVAEAVQYRLLDRSPTMV